MSPEEILRHLREDIALAKSGLAPKHPTMAWLEPWLARLDDALLETPATSEAEPWESDPEWFILDNDAVVYQHADLPRNWYVDVSYNDGEGFDRMCSIAGDTMREAVKHARAAAEEGCTKHLEPWYNMGRRLEAEPESSRFIECPDDDVEPFV